MRERERERERETETEITAETVTQDPSLLSRRYETRSSKFGSYFLRDHNSECEIIALFQYPLTPRDFHVQQTEMIALEKQISRE